ncbi:hypothetical protein E2C01_074068 [Portunus trituberculatus]|uniref:Uncharacterized protein n=1 Tax=Portunus trituberculatus TaxID=210409 RepID=A0A5B7ICD7_PORTR|nr:hypothetical protein [Portunus trituberculatus]
MTPLQITLKNIQCLGHVATIFPPSLELGQWRVIPVTLLIFSYLPRIAVDLPQCDTLSLSFLPTPAPARINPSAQSTPIPVLFSPCGRGSDAGGWLESDSRLFSCSSSFAMRAGGSSALLPTRLKTSVAVRVVAASPG